jgi:hypothetical protein
MKRFLKHVHSVHLRIINKFKHTFPGFYALIGGIGLITFWYGWTEFLHTTQILQHPVVSMLIGLSIMFGTGLIVAIFVGDKHGMDADDGQSELDRSYLERRLHMLDKYAQQEEMIESEEYFS